MSTSPAPGTGGTVSGVGRFLKKKEKETRSIAWWASIRSAQRPLQLLLYQDDAHAARVQGRGHRRGHPLRRDGLLRRRRVPPGERQGVVPHGAPARARGRPVLRRVVGQQRAHRRQARQGTGPGKTIVTVLPDSATRYTTKFLNDAWMKDYGFLGSDRDLGLVEDMLHDAPSRSSRPASPRPIGQVIETFKSKGVSQVPIVDAKGNPVVDGARGRRAAGFSQRLGDADSPAKAWRTRWAGSSTPRHGSKSSSGSSRPTRSASSWTTPRSSASSARSTCSSS
jgi:hypothetical protein